jgi:Hemerythrin HHE cation binding domain
MTLDRPGSAMWLPPSGPRRPGEPVPDLTAWRVLHRAALVDIGEFARAAGGLAAGTGGAEVDALRRYLAPVLTAVDVHLEIASRALPPLLARRAGPDAFDVLDQVVADRAVLEPLLGGAASLVDAVPAAAGELRDALDDLAPVLHEQLAEQERRLFPLITTHLTGSDMRWVRQQMRRAAGPGVVSFLAVWLHHHSSAEEAERLLRDTCEHVGPLVAIFGTRYAEQRCRALGLRSWSHG